jgi:hypothetical protein
MEHNNDAYDYRKPDRGAHAAIAAAEVEIQTGFRLRCRHPLEELSTCYIDAIKGSDDGVGHQPCLVGK